jgi:hypothetical protein
MPIATGLIFFGQISKVKFKSKKKLEMKRVRRVSIGKSGTQKKKK